MSGKGLSALLTGNSVLGWVPGLITILLSGILFWITSITMHKYIMKHPQILDICEFEKRPPPPPPPPRCRLGYCGD